jgi:hypothetical protein
LDQGWLDLDQIATVWAAFAIHFLSKRHRLFVRLIVLKQATLDAGL